MALLLFQCGAVPVTDPVEGPVVVMPDTDRLVICCCCHRAPSLPPPPPPVAQVQPQQPENRLPDLIPSFPTNKTPAKSPPVQVRLVPDDEDADADETDDGKISTREWRQLGHDLRLIADRFRHERGRSAESSTHWIWNAVIQTAAVYVGWRLHRWATGA